VRGKAAFWGNSTRTVVVSRERFTVEMDPGNRKAKITALVSAIREHRGWESDIGQYGLQIFDPDTGMLDQTFTANRDDLKEYQDGFRTGSMAPAASAVTLADVSDEDLVAELLRRIRR
jgi:hypothetical protein